MIDITRRGSTYDAMTDTRTPVVTTIRGAVMKIADDGRAYRDLNLVEGAGVTLLFVPETYGGLSDPTPGDEVPWANATWVVRRVTAIAPDGVPIMYRLVVSQ